MSKTIETEETQEPPIVLPDDTPVDLQAEMVSSNVMGILDELDRELIGLKPVKTRIRGYIRVMASDATRGTESQKNVFHCESSKC